MAISPIPGSPVMTAPPVDTVLSSIDTQCLDELKDATVLLEHRKKVKKGLSRKAIRKLKNGLKRSKKRSKKKTADVTDDTSIPSTVAKIASPLPNISSNNSILSMPDLTVTTTPLTSIDDLPLDNHKDDEDDNFLHLKQTLSSLKSQSTDLQIKANQSNERIQILVKQLTKLESTVETLTNQYRIETKTLQSNTDALERLENKRVSLEEHSSSLKQRHDSNNHIQPNRERIATAESFITADAASNSLNSTFQGEQDKDNIDITVTGSPSSFSDATVRSSSRKNTLPQPPKRLSSFLRVHDLELPNNNDATDDSMSLPNECRDDAANDSETSLSTRSDLFSLDRNDRKLVLDALCNIGFKYATDEGPRWSPDKGTERIMSKQNQTAGKWQSPPLDNNILVWSGKFDTAGGFGSNLPVIKARGRIPGATAIQVFDLLLDSSRVKEYNKMSLGRTDKVSYHSCQQDNEQVVSKVIHSLSKPPIIRKNIELLSLIHARKLNDFAHDGHKGYIVVSRSVWENENKVPTDESKGTGTNSNCIRSEMLLGVNLIRESDNVTELTTVTHLCTPGIPTFGAKKIAMVVAANFIRDIQNVFN